MNRQTIIQQKRIDSVDLLPIGTIIRGSYQITDIIGAGSGGVVYKAKHLSLNADIVVKKIRSKKQDALLIRQEADILKRLKHPYLPRIYDFVFENDGIYTVMDYISGSNLQDMLERYGRFEQKQVRKWAEQLGEALDYLHSQKPAIVHSDIKPENIMITMEGNVCLIDFNVSLAMGEEIDLAGLTPGYAAPEMYPSLEKYLQAMQGMQRRKQIPTPSPIPAKMPQQTPVYTGETVTSGGQESATQLLYQDEQTTMLLGGTEPATQLLHQDEQKTMLLGGTEPVTQLHQEEQATVLLGGTEPATQLLHQDEQATMLLGGTEPATQFLSKSEQETQLLGKKQNSTVANQGQVHTQVPQFQQMAYQNPMMNQPMNYSNGYNGKIPEYAKYIGRGLDEKSDIYSLGATLYILLTGKSIPIYFDQQNPTKDLFTFVSEGFLQILTKMLELDPEKRYKDGGEYLRALRNCKKLDHRYVQMRRKQLIMQMASVACIVVGILLTAFGIRKNTMEQNNEYYGILEQAEQQIEMLEYNKAMELLEEAKLFNKERIEAYETEIFLLYNMGAYEECATRGKNYINAPLYIVSNENDRVSLGNIYYIVGNAYYELGQYDNATVLMEAAIKENSGNALYYRDYAICLAKLGDGEGAKAQLGKGSELGLNRDSMQMAQGEIAFVQNKNEEAIQCFTECINSTTDAQMRSRAILACAEVYRRSGNDFLEDEIDILLDYLATYGETGNMAVKEKLAECYTRKAIMVSEESSIWYEKALEVFLKMYNSGYATYQIQENIAILYENMGQFDEAEKMLNQLAEAFPQRYEVYKRLAYLEADKQQKKAVLNRDYRKMKNYFEQAVTLYQEDIQDMEMEMLKNMIQELTNGGWF